MNILVSHNYYREPGGEDLTFEEEVQLLEQHGHSVRSFVADNKTIKGNFPILTGVSTIWSQAVYRSVVNMLRGRGFSIAHFHNTFPLISPSAYYAARAAKVPVVQSLHNFRLICPGGTLLRGNSICEICTKKRVPWPAIKYACYRKDRAITGCVTTLLSMHHFAGTWRDLVDAYVVCSEFVRSKFVDAGFPAEKIFVKPNFVSPDPGFREHAGKYFLFAGRLSPEKGIATLLAAWQKLGAGIDLVIAGDGPLREDVGRACARQRNIRWVGQKSHYEVLALMKDASCLVFPSIWYETFGRVIAEAYACGVPVIATDVGARSCPVRNGETGLYVRSADADDLVEKIEWVRAHPQEMAEMGRQAREEYEKHYTAEGNYTRLMEIYSIAAAS